MGALVGFWTRERHTKGDHLGSLLTDTWLLHPVRFLRFRLRGVKGREEQERELTFTSLYRLPGSVFGVSLTGHVVLPTTLSHSVLLPLFSREDDRMLRDSEQLPKVTQPREARAGVGPALCLLLRISPTHHTTFPRLPVAGKHSPWGCEAASGPRTIWTQSERGVFD